MAETDVKETKENDEETQTEKRSAFSDPAYKELSRLNGKINQMSKTGIILKLTRLKLSTDGTCEVLKKRLKTYYKTKTLTNVNVHSNSSQVLAPYYVIIDFEATCHEVNPANYKHEIIEFPAILVSSEQKKIIDEFQSYCQPILDCNLSEFCKELTGISQEDVDNADTFPCVLKNFEAWLRKHELGTKHKFGIVTDGPWDMGRFLQGQCEISQVQYPYFAKRWINIRKIFSNFYKSKRFSLKYMLEHLAMEFEGRPHCGLDDARNIARVLLRLISDGASIQINERIHLGQHNGTQRIALPDERGHFTSLKSDCEEAPEEINSSEKE